jgi:hypothetical protein
VTRVVFRYDALGRPIQKEIFRIHRQTYLASISRLTWSGSALVRTDTELRSPTGAIQSKRAITWVALHPASTPVLRIEGSQVHAVFTDPHGLPRELVDEDGRVVRRLPVGVGPVVTDEVGVFDEPPTMPFPYPGHLRDEDTGIHFGAGRWYSTELRAALSADEAVDSVTHRWTVVPYLRAAPPRSLLAGMDLSDPGLVPGDGDLGLAAGEV